jgi:hypothetical protein
MEREIISSYLPPEQLEILRVAEESERGSLSDLVRRIARDSE